MTSKLLAVLFCATFFSLQAHATPFNGYIVKVKKDSSFLSSKAAGAYGQITKTTETSFGTFGRLETDKSLSDKALQGLTNNPEIEYIEPNYIITVNSNKDQAPMDVMFSRQWGLANNGRSGGLGEDINAKRAWEITKGNMLAPIKIAVIDSGVDYNHPDLTSQIDVSLAEKFGIPGVDDDGNGYVDDIYGYDFANKDGDPMDDGDGHGTHCAGVIGAAHNSIGVAGVMAHVKIVPIKFLNAEGVGETIDAISSIDYAIKRGVRVMSNSWGGEEREQSLLDAIAAAESAGITFVAAAGNDASDNDTVDSFPGNYELSNIISVGSFASTGAMSDFSNYGIETVHVMAPGTNILSTYKGKYATLSGTSMAAPHVAGIVGLLLSQEPNLNPQAIRERLIRTSVQTPKLKMSSISRGRVDAYRALMNQ